MPLYEFRCECGAEFERYLPVSGYDTPQECQCGAKARRIISIPTLVVVSPDINYDSPIDGRPITSMAARREDLARSNCTPYDPDIKQDYHRRIEQSERALEKAVDETVDRELSNMPARKREKLEAELNAGLTAEPVRSTAAAKPIVKQVR